MFAKLSVNTCVMLACSFLVIKQHLDANKSIRSEQLAFEGLMADFKGAEASNDELQTELSESQLKCIDLQTKLDAAEQDLEKTRCENDELRIERNELRVEREKFLIKVNDLNKKLTEASVGFQRFRYLHYGAGAKSKIDYTKRRITSFEDVVDILNDVIDRLRQQHGE